MSQLLEDAFPAERNRLVGLAARITGNAGVAEDLTQEALMEAWRSREKIYDPAGLSRWLSVITRNVCRRWMREQGQADWQINEAENEPDDLYDPTPDLEIELERNELADLLDRALANLPADTRTALVQKYILELPQAEIAARMGLSEGAVEARLMRGKLSLHKLLVQQYPVEAAGYGWLTDPSAGWVETRIWCPICGNHRLYGVLPTPDRAFELHCPHCSWLPDQYFAQSTYLPEFSGVSGFRTILRRFSIHLDALFAERTDRPNTTCRRCGKLVPLQFELPEWIPQYLGMGRHGVYQLCPNCGSTSHTCIYGITLDSPVGRTFWQQNPRIHTLPAREITYQETPALLVRLENQSNTSALEVVLAADRYQILSATSLSI
jgi:RNA polymerase sigma-70 factor (ECF subfamily)